MTDEQDQPEVEGWGLVMPFVVCKSKGGPYDDDSFVAGYQAGQVEKALRAAAVADADRVRVTVLTALLPQLELIGMHHGFPVLRAESSDEWPTWSMVTLTCAEGTDQP